MALAAIAEDYFRTINPIAEKIHRDVTETKNAYEHIWNTLSDKEKQGVIDESIIKPDIALKYALIDTFDFDINDPQMRKDDLMSFFGKEHGQKIMQDETYVWRDEHSAPFIFHTRSQLDLCMKDVKDKMPNPELSELAISHSKVVSELRNALKTHDKLKSISYERKSIDTLSPTNFLTKFIGSKFRKNDDQERLVANESRVQILRSPSKDTRLDVEYRSVLKSNSDLSEENRGLLSSASRGSSSTDVLSFPDMESRTASQDTLAASALPRTGFDFLDNW